MVGVQDWLCGTDKAYKRHIRKLKGHAAQEAAAAVKVAAPQTSPKSE
jgi:hypothetical protein